MNKKLPLWNKSIFLKPTLIALAACPLLLAGSSVKAQDSFKSLANLFTVPYTYTAPYASAPPKIDGNINDKIWANVPWVKDFTDIEGSLKPEPYYKTRCKMLWDKDYLYIAAQIEDPQIWAYVKNHDEVVFQDNDFEIFIDPNNDTHEYYEIEVNAINTIWDLFLSKPYRNGPGGGLTDWEAKGLRSAVKVQGTVNNPKDTDKGWTVEMAIPFDAVSMREKGKSPENGDFWRINFSRVQWRTSVKDGKYVKDVDSAGKTLPEHNWVWSPQGLIAMHFPERWGYLKFSTAAPGTAEPAFEIPYAEQQKNYLWLVYYKQKEYFEKNQKYAPSLAALDIPATYTLGSKNNTLNMESTQHQFFVSTLDEQQHLITINQDGLVQTLNK